jgi:hypothetical protein
LHNVVGDPVGTGHGAGDEGMTDNSANESTLTVEGAVRPEPKPLIQTKADVDTSAFAAFVDSNKAEVTTDSMAALSSLAEELLTRERALAKAMAAVVQANEDLRKVAEELLPDLMESYSLARFDFVDKVTGIKRTIELHKDKWRVAMPPKSGKNADPAWQMKHDAIYEWLESVGQAAVIKKDLEAPLGLLPDDKVAEVAGKFKELYPDVDVAVKKYVEPATFTAMINKRLKNNEAVNEYVVTKPVREAKVKGAK